MTPGTEEIEDKDYPMWAVFYGVKQISEGFVDRDMACAEAGRMRFVLQREPSKYGFSIQRVSSKEAERE